MNKAKYNKAGILVVNTVALLISLRSLKHGKCTKNTGIHTYHFLLLNPVRNLVWEEAFQHTQSPATTFLKYPTVIHINLFLLIDRPC